VTFDVEVVTNADLGADGGGPFGTVTAADGLLRTDLAGQATHIVSRRPAQDGSDLLGTWNLASGAFVPYPRFPVDPGRVQAGPTPALSYTWGASGAGEALLPGQALAPGTPPSAPPLTAVGGPTDASFSFWQPASISTVTIYNSATQQSTVVPGVYSVWLDLLAWSPDGRFATETPLDGLLETNATLDAATLRQAQVATLPVLPMRDAGLRAALSALDAAQAQSAETNQGQQMEVAWSPDGTRLATLVSIVAVSTTGRATVKTAVTVYDCASGKVLASLTPALTNGPDLFGSGFDELAWSPDGSHLLAYTPQAPQATVWHLRGLK
jgi:hypothetical protein